MKLTNFKVLVMLLGLTPLLTMAQRSGQKKSDQVVVLIEKHIAERRADKIYSMGNKQYKAAISQKELEENGREIYVLGKIKKSSFISSNKGMNKYKLAFEAGNVELSFSLDQTTN